MIFSLGVKNYPTKLRFNFLICPSFKFDCCVDYSSMKVRLLNFWLFWRLSRAGPFIGGMHFNSLEYLLTTVCYWNFSLFKGTLQRTTSDTNRLSINPVVDFSFKILHVLWILFTMTLCFLEILTVLFSYFSLVYTYYFQVIKIVLRYPIVSNLQFSAPERTFIVSCIKHVMNESHFTRIPLSQTLNNW